MIGKRNSGKFQQDAVIGRFARDARSTVTGGSAVEVAIRQGKLQAELTKRKAAELAEKPRFSFRTL